MYRLPLLTNLLKSYNEHISLYSIRIAIYQHVIDYVSIIPTGLILALKRLNHINL